MMDDVFDYNGPFGSQEYSRSREELETENKRLRAELHHQREENQLLAELLTGQFEEDGEIDDPVEEGEGFTEKRSRFVISEAAIDLFEALPEAFTLDEALDAAERLGVISSKAALYLHAYIQEDMVVQEGSRFTKTGRKPYF